MPVATPSLNIGALGGAAVQFGTGYLNLQTNQFLNGGSDIMGQAGLYGRGIGSVIGGVLGSFFGPVGTAAGMAIGGGAGEALLKYAAAPLAGNADAALNALPIFAARYGAGGIPAVQALTSRSGAFGMFGGYNGSSMENLMAQINGIPGKGGLPEYARVGLEGTGRAYSSIAEGLFAGGQDPFGPGYNSPAGVAYPYAGYRDRFALGGADGRIGTKMIDTVIGAAGTALSYSGRYRTGGQETLTDTYTRRLGKLVGGRFDDVSKNVIQPILGSRPETGDNVADILERFGPEATSTWLAIQNEDLKSSVDPMLLARTSANLRTGDRLAAMAGTQARGVGAAQRVIYTGELSDVSALPGGSESLTASRIRQQIRESTLEEYRASDITGFEIPSARLQGARDRANLLPYNPSNVFGLDAATIALDRRQEAILGNRMDSLRRSGNLSEDEELRLTRQQEALHTDEFARLREITEGRENLIPGLSAGRPRLVGQFTSDQAEALSFANGRVPYRFAGAVNGADLARQDRAAADLGLSPSDLRPGSRTQEMNSGSGGGGADPDIKRLLSAILSAIQGGNAQGARANESYGQGYGTISQRDVARGNATVDMGAN
jgi:hypothetical protein